MKKRNVGAILRELVMLFVLIAVIAVFAILGPVVADRNFLAIQNLLNILSQNAYLVILGIGITFIMLGGAMDLSTGFLISTVGIIVARVDLATNNSFIISLLVGLAAAVLLSTFNGAIYSWLKVFPFIITLGTQYVLNGATYLLSGGMTQTYKGLSNGFKVLGGWNIPFLGGSLKSGVLVMVIMVAIGSFILNKTHFGRNVYALGSNPDAVALSGVSVAKMRIAIFALAGLFFGIAQAVNIGRLSNTVNNSMGIGDEFIVMAGCMLGGIKMGGGGGKMSNMVIGVLIIGVLNSGMNFLNMNQYWQYVALGIALLAAVTLDTMQTRAAIKAAKKVSAPVVAPKEKA